MRRLFLSAALAVLIPSVASADAVETALETALQAYRDGDIVYALDEIVEAQRLINEAKTASLAAFLPEVPEGWMREINTEMGAGMALFGGGLGAEATYTTPDGTAFRITLLADSPMVSSMAAILGNTAMMGQMGKVRRIARVRFLEQDTQLSALIGNRVLVQAQDAAPDVMAPLLEKIDFAAIEKFGS